MAQTACMSACQHLSMSLMQMLLDSELKQISMGAIQQFNLDVIQCECKYIFLSVLLLTLKNWKKLFNVSYIVILFHNLLKLCLIWKYNITVHLLAKVFLSMLAFLGNFFNETFLLAKVSELKHNIVVTPNGIIITISRKDLVYYKIPQNCYINIRF